MAVWGSYGFVAVRSVKGREIVVALAGAEKLAETWRYRKGEVAVVAFLFHAVARREFLLFPAPDDPKGFRYLARTLQLRAGGRVEEIPIPE